MAQRGASPRSLGPTDFGPRGFAALPWLLGLVLAAAVGFAIYLWQQPPKYTPASTSDVQTRVPPGPGVREPIPRGDLPGWHQTLAEDFGGAALDPARWRVYSGQPGGDRAAWFDPAHVKVTGGMLVISGYRDPAHRGKWTTGGVSTGPALAQTYGKYLVRFRLDSGDGIGHTLVLVPADGSWPPEIDFSEDNGANRLGTLATLHYGGADQRISKYTPVFLTQWHTLGVEWAPQQLRFTLDGRVWFQIHGTHVPSKPMSLAIQTQSWPCIGTWGRCPDVTTPPVVRMDVDWVVAYAPVRPR